MAKKQRERSRRGDSASDKEEEERVSESNQCCQVAKFGYIHLVTLSQFILLQ